MTANRSVVAMLAVVSNWMEIVAVASLTFTIAVWPAYEDAVPGRTFKYPAWSPKSDAPALDTY
jgi:hypothetical protein